MSLWPDHSSSPPVVNEQILIYFVAYCKERGLRYQTIKHYLAGIKYQYITCNVETPLQRPHELLRLQIVLRGVKKSQTNTTQRRLPVTLDILKAIIDVLNKGFLGQYDSCMMAAACSMAFFGFLRCGEFANKASSCLKISDIAFENDNSNYTLHLASSKTDVFREGAKVRITANNTSVCPVHYMRQYRDLRLRAGAKPHDPLFLNSHGSVLTRGYVLGNLKKILQKTGHDSHLYTGHSFRIGAATTAARVGIPDHLIQTLGRWSSDSYLRYIRVDPTSVAKSQVRMSRD